MADVQHSTIADADRHENKGASSAVAGSYLRGNGDGTTTFQLIPYSEVNGTPDLSSLATAVQADGSIPMTGPLKLAPYLKAALPSVTTYQNYLIVVTDATGGPALCISNGTDWIDIHTGTAVA